MSQGQHRDLLSQTVYSFCNTLPDFSVSDDGESYLLWVEPKGIRVQFTHTFTDHEGFGEDIGFTLMISVWSTIDVINSLAENPTGLPLG